MVLGYKTFMHLSIINKYLKKMKLLLNTGLYVLCSKIQVSLGKAKILDLGDICMGRHIT